MDPVDLLPPEVSSEIIAYASLATLHTQWLRKIISVDLLLEMMLVSVNWRDLILATPELWADIVIDGHTHDGDAKIALQSELSKQYPFSVTLVSDEGLGLPLFSDHTRHRIRELNVRYEAQLDRCLATWGPLPCLLSLHVRAYKLHETPGEEAISYIDKHPHLKTIGNMSLDVDLLTSNWLHCLRDVSIGVPLHELVPHLHALSNVRTGWLFRSRRNPHDSLEPYRVDRLPCLPWTELTVTEPENDVSWHLWQNFDVIVPALAQKLTIFKIIADLKLLSMLLPRLAEFVCLVEFGIFLHPLGTLDIEPRSIHASLVRKIRIETHHRPQYISPESLETLISAIMQCFRHTTNIYLYGELGGRLLPLLSQDALPKLHEVSVRYTADDYGSRFTLSPRVRILELYPSHRNIARYRSEDLQELTGTFDEDTADTVDASTLDLHLWPSMNRLITSGRQHINWMGATFTSLSAISLMGSGYANTAYQGTQLLYILSLYPGRFPSLIKLELTSLVEWDIFFCFLEARNTRTEEPYARIQTIIFNEIIPTRFPELISSLLSGDKVDRPSNFELSWIGNLDLLRDLNIPGCMESFKCLRPCKMSTLPDLEDADLPTLRRYPVKNTDVLLTWPAREAEWNQYTTSQRRRRMLCRHDVNRTTTITAHGYYVV